MCLDTQILSLKVDSFSEDEIILTEWPTKHCIDSPKRNEHSHCGMRKHQRAVHVIERTYDIVHVVFVYLPSEHV